MMLTAGNRATFFVFVCFVICLNYVHAAASNDSKIEWEAFADSERKSSLQTEFDDKGLQPWFNFAVSFINTVLNKEPYDLMLDVKENRIMDDPVNDLVLGYLLGVVITVGIGVLFCVLMPIVGFCFCCCRCCGKCGGEMSQKEKPNNACKRAVFGLLLVIITLLMLTGVLLTFVCNHRMSDTVDRLKDTTYGILDEMANFVNDTVEEFDIVVSKDFPMVTKRITADIGDQGIQELVGKPLLEVLKSGTIGPLEKVKLLSENTNKMNEQLTLISNTTESLKEEGQKLQQGLDVVKNNLSEIATECNNISLPGSPPGPPSFCASIDPSNLALDANFSAVPDVGSELNKIQDITNQDFAGSAQKGIDTLTDIPNTIINKTMDARREVLTLVSNATRQVDTYKEDLDDMVNDKIFKEIDTLKKNMDKPFDEVKTYDKYRWYAGVGLACILLLIVTLLALGLMCGICGHDKEATPSTRGTVSNMGGLSLMAAVGFCFIFSSFLMLLTTICFIIGAPVQKACGTVQSGDIYPQFLDKPEYWNGEYIFAKSVYGKPNAKVTFGGVLKNCRDNQPAYKAASIHLVFNVSDKLNIKKLLGDTIDKEFDNMKTNLSDQTILSNETRTSLQDLIDSGVEEINFDQFLNETRKGITKVNLTEFAQNLTEIAKKFTVFNRSDLARRMNESAEDLLQLERVNVQAMRNKSDELETNVEDLKLIGERLKDLANETLQKAEEAETYLHTNAPTEIIGIIQNYTDRVLGYGYQFSDRIISLLNNEMARCKPLANIVDATVVVICNDALYPFNGFWLSIGWCLFFFIPAIILGVKLAKHYRCMDYESEFDQEEMGEVYEMGHPHSSAPPPYNANVGNEKKLWSNANNSQVNQY